MGRQYSIRLFLLFAEPIQVTRVRAEQLGHRALKSQFSSSNLSLKLMYGRCVQGEHLLTAQTLRVRLWTSHFIYKVIPLQV